MESIALVLCLATVATAQLLHPISTMGMGTGFGNQMFHMGMRYPGVTQTSQLSSMTYPSWRNHPLFRMAPVVSEKTTMGSNLAGDVINVPKVPSSQEILTHMAMNNPNPKPYLDTIADFFYEPQKARAVVTPVVAAVAAPVSPPVYSQGVNLMRASMPSMPLADDCGPQEARWERGMDWLY